MKLILFILIGGITGWLAGEIRRGHGFGLIGNIVVGIFGSVIGSLLVGVLGLSATGLIGQLVVATLGAVVGTIPRDSDSANDRIAVVDRLRSGVAISDRDYVRDRLGYGVRNWG